MRNVVEIETVLSECDPHPVEAINLEGSSPIFLTCEHAGRLLPVKLLDQGIPADDMERHIAFDVGAAELGLLLSQRLNAPLFMQRYSRLVVDCNRPFEAPDCFPEISDGTVIPFNRSLSTAGRKARYAAIHKPFHDAVRNAMEARLRAGMRVLLVSVHSFTRVMRATGEVRQCSLGLLFNRDARLAQALMAHVNANAPNVRAAYNMPYVVDDIGDYTIPVHGEGLGVPHVLLEVVNDELADSTGQVRWADILAPALRQAAEDMLASNSEIQALAD